MTFAHVYSKIQNKAASDKVLCPDNKPHIRYTSIAPWQLVHSILLRASWFSVFEHPRWPPVSPACVTWMTSDQCDLGTMICRRSGEPYNIFPVWVSRPSFSFSRTHWCHNFLTVADCSSTSRHSGFVTGDSTLSMMNFNCSDYLVGSALKFTRVFSIRWVIIHWRCGSNNVLIVSWCWHDTGIALNFKSRWVSPFWPLKLEPFWLL